jgi:adenylate kinase family enzyme
MSKIFHISGSPASGKTTLGKRLKNILKNNIIIKDLDDLRDEFIKKFYGNKSWTYIDENEYQKHIDDFIKKAKKDIIFVGLNDNTRFGKNKKLYYNVHSSYNYYIDIDDKTIVKQSFLRLINNIKYNKMAINDLINNNEKFLKKFSEEIIKTCSIQEITKFNNVLKNYYKKNKYKFMTSDKIYNSIINSYR